MTEGHQEAFAGSVNKRFVDVATSLRVRIRSGRYLKGEQLPAIDRLAREFGVAVVTVRHALSVLESEGLVQRRHGVGTFVLEVTPLPDRLRLPLDADWGGLRTLWRGSSTRILEQRASVPCPLAGEVAGERGETFHFMKRLHSVDGTPYTVADIFVANSVYRLAPARFRKEIAMHVLAELFAGRRLDAHETIRIESADAETAAQLQIPHGAPVVVATRVIRDESGRLVYVGTPVYRGDIVRLERSFIP